MAPLWGWGWGRRPWGWQGVSGMGKGRWNQGRDGTAQRPLQQLQPSKEPQETGTIANPLLQIKRRGCGACRSSLSWRASWSVKLCWGSGAQSLPLLLLPGPSVQETLERGRRQGHGRGASHEDLRTLASPGGGSGRTCPCVWAGGAEDQGGRRGRSLEGIQLLRTLCSGTYSENLSPL